MIRRRLLGPQPSQDGVGKEPPPSPARQDGASQNPTTTVTPRTPPPPRTQSPKPPTAAPTKSKETDVSQRPESIQSVPRSGGDQTVTVIGSGARLEGNLIAAASLRIEGTVNGTITAEGDVIVAPEADVAADIKATNATLGGRYKGNVSATGTIELTSTARVEGNLTSRTLVVNSGAIFSGQSIMDGGAKKPTPVPSPALSGATPPALPTGMTSPPTAP